MSTVSTISRCGCTICPQVVQSCGEIVLFVHCQYNLTMRLYYLSASSAILRRDCTTCPQPVQNNSEIAFLPQNLSNQVPRSLSEIHPSIAYIYRTRWTDGQWTPFFRSYRYIEIGIVSFLYSLRFISYCLSN